MRKQNPTACRAHECSSRKLLTPRKRRKWIVRAASLLMPNAKTKSQQRMMQPQAETEEEGRCSQGKFSQTRKPRKSFPKKGYLRSSFGGIDRRTANFEPCFCVLQLSSTKPAATLGPLSSETANFWPHPLYFLAEVYQGPTIFCDISTINDTRGTEETWRRVWSFWQWRQRQADSKF